MATSSTTPKRAFGKLFNAVAIAAALCASSASQAGVLDFEAPQDQPLVFVGVPLTFGEYRVEAAYSFGALITNDDCAGLQCPVNNPTTYFGGLNDGYFVFGKTDNSQFKISNLDASFIGAGAASYPGVSALLYVAGFNASGSLVRDTYLSLPGPTTGQFRFTNFSLGSFSNYEFTDVIVASFACDLAGNCNRNTNGANFAVDNITTFVPEPGSFALMGLGLLGLGAASRRRAAKA